MAAQAPATGRRQTQIPTRKIVQGLLSVVLVVVIFWFVFKGIDVSQVWNQIRAMTWLELTTLLAVAIWNLVTYLLVWVAVTPGLSYPQAMTLTQSGTAIANTVPGGAAIGIGLTYAMLGSWGFSKSRATLAILVSGVWNSFVKLGLPVLALALVALQGNASPARVTAALIGIGALAGAVAVFAAMLRSEQGARRVGELAGRAASRCLRLLGRPPVHGWELATVKFRVRTIGLLHDRWPWITAVSLLSHLSLYLVLLLTLRHVGVSNAAVSWAEVLAVFAFARLATALPFTPGGLGVVEGVLIGGLVAAGGDKVKVVAAVLVYRALTWLLPVPVGVGTYLWWRRRSIAPATEEAPSPVGVGAP
jgi:uncharacterized protein (TIRG00374 family)